MLHTMMLIVAISQVLQALPEDMPLHLAVDTLTSMMSSAMHHRRRGQVREGA